MMMDGKSEGGGKKGLLAALILGKVKKAPAEKPGEKEAVLEEDTSGVGAEAAGEELLRAIEQKDAKAVAEAFQTLMSCCQGGEDEESDVEME